LQIAAYTQAFVDELIGAERRVLDDVIVVAVVNDVHACSLQANKRCASCNLETSRRAVARPIAAAFEEDVSNFCATRFENGVRPTGEMFCDMSEHI
jgi:hypothetical protein